LRRWTQEAGRLRPWLLDLLSAEQGEDLRQGRATFQARYADLPAEIRQQIEGLARRYRRDVGGRPVGGEVRYYRIIYSSMPDAEPVVVEGRFEIQGSRGNKEWQVVFPFSDSQGGGRRCKPRPQIMHRNEVARSHREVTPEEFGRWWEWAVTQVVPLAGAAKQEHFGKAVAFSVGEPSQEQLSAARQYLLEVLPKPAAFGAPAGWAPAFAHVAVEYTGFGSMPPWSR